MMDWLQQIWRTIQLGHFTELGAWSYLVLALLVLVEGPMATLLGAAASATGMMRPELVFVSAAAGNLSADMLWYSLGRAGKTEWILRFGKRFGVRPRHLEYLKREMHNHATKILLFAKLTAGFIIPSLIAAGLAKVSWRRWFPAIFSGEMIWTGSLVLIGFYATQALKQIERGIEYFLMAASSLFLLVLAFWILRLIHNHNRPSGPLLDDTNDN